MRNISGELKAILLSSLLLVPLVTHAQNEATDDMANRCKLARSEVAKSGELFTVFMEPWLKQGLDKLEIDRNEFTTSRVKNFNKQYAEMRRYYANHGSFDLNDPINRSNDISLRLQFVVDAFQSFAADGDRASLKDSWSVQYKAMQDDFAMIKSACSKKSNL